jgi:superfamily II DNA/RNA helicase
MTNAATDTKHGADNAAKSLVKAGIQADAFHSNKSQSARQRVLLRFKAPQPLVLMATDIATRGLDIDEVLHVVNFDLPVDADGRTGRAGAAGVAVSFCDRATLQAIQRLTRQTLSVEAQPADMPSVSGGDQAARQRRLLRARNGLAAYVGRMGGVVAGTARGGSSDCAAVHAGGGS